MNRTRARRSPADPAEPAVARITTAKAPLSEDVGGRMRRYLLQMSIRVVCFVGAVAVDHWTRWVLLAGAVVLPYVAVVLANAGQERSTDPGTFLTPGPPPALTSGPAEEPALPPDPPATEQGPGR